MMAVLTCLLLMSATGWELVNQKYGYEVEERSVPGSDLYEVRVTAHTVVEVKDLFDVVWDVAAYPSFVPYSKEAKILSEDGQARYIYQRNSIPLMEDRDYTTHTWFTHDPKSGAWHIEWVTANDRGPPPMPRTVRIQDTHGKWDFVPSSEGGTDISYTIASEAGGNIPSWLVRAAQANAAPDFLRVVIRRAGD